jgi:hypothetical protein
MMRDKNKENGMTVRDMDHWPMDEYPHLLHFLCHHSAAKIIKQQLAARGERVREYSAKDIRSLAEDYVEANRELLMAEAIIKVRKEPSLLRLAESESKRRARERIKPMDPRRALELLSKVKR